MPTPSKPMTWNASSVTVTPLDLATVQVTCTIPVTNSSGLIGDGWTPDNVDAAKQDYEKDATHNTYLSFSTAELEEFNELLRRRSESNDSQKVLEALREGDTLREVLNEVADANALAA